MISLLKALQLIFFSFFLPLVAQAAEVVLTEREVVQFRPGIWLASGLELPASGAKLPIVADHHTDEGARLLRIIAGRSEISGLAGVLYDNRDRGHSSLDLDLYPRLTALKYSSEFSEAGLDVGLAGRIFLPAVVLGNSSTAVRKGAAPRSLPRLAMTSAFWRAVTPTLYENNCIYVYPEHRDHDAEDRYPVNWPYMIISQGSSGSDKRFLHAVAMTLAALPSDTFEFLRKERLVAPTVQMILRRNLKNVATREDYLSGKAHPTVFEGRLVQTGRMVAQAASLQPDDIPPLVRLRVVDEEFSEAGGLAGLEERLVNTPSAIGRIWRSFAWERELLVTAEDTSEPNDRPLTFEWRLLRGDPQRVWIEPQGGNGATAKIRVAWHDPWTEPVPGKKKKQKLRQYSRVDIGVFANNGKLDSAPAIISIDFPEHQVRRYEAVDQAEKRLVSIDYDAKVRGAYLDPLLFWSADWTDTARYATDGKLLGWERQNTGDTSASFVPHDEENQSRFYEINRGDARMPTLRRKEKP
ncbi:hypothetical protein ACS3QZ_18275 [Shimia sp. W99]